MHISKDIITLINSVVSIHLAAITLSAQNVLGRRKWRH